MQVQPGAGHKSKAIAMAGTYILRLDEDRLLFKAVQHMYAHRSEDNLLMAGCSKDGKLTRAES